LTYGPKGPLIFVWKGLRKMAPRQQSRRAPAPPVQSRASQRSRETYAQQIEAAEVSRSRKAAILQLRMGRLAHEMGIGSGLALAATAVLAYLLENWSVLIASSEYGTLQLLKWLVPIIAGLIIAIIALVVKWEPYFADRDEPHFIMSIVAVAFSALMAILIVLDETGNMALGRPDWLYSASMLGITLTLVSLAMTWEGSGRRKVISLVSAIFPPVLLLFPLVYPFTANELASILPMAYLGSAVAIQLSGSMLHIIASSTSLLQREVLKASDGKLKEQIQDVEKRRKALQYREDALRSKESDLEAYEKRLSEELASIDEKKTQSDAMEAELEQRVEQARAARQQQTKGEVDLESKLETLRLKQADIDNQVKELERRSKAVSSKEEKIAARETDANRMLLDAQAKDRDVKNRLAEIQAVEASAVVKDNQLKALQGALAQREKQIGVRESALDMRSLEVIAAKEQLGKVAAEKTQVKSLEQQLLMKQEALSERDIALRAKEDDIRKEAERAQRLIERADRQINELVGKEGAVLAKEKTLSEKEAELRKAIESFNSQMEDVQQSKATLSDREKEFRSLSDSTRTRLAELVAREEEASRRMTALDRREQNVKELDQRLKSEQERMNAKLKELLETEKDLQAAETEMGLKHAEMKVMERDVLERVEAVESARAQVPGYEDEREKTIDLREKHLRDKEQEMKARLYQREKELEKRERALESQLKKDIEAMEEQVEEEYAEEKVKTGMERLDDLLMGGIPFASTVLCIGPPFIGKETAMLLFLAEGLRKGVPIVIVTTSRPPSEIEKDMAPILPTFMEFEQLGLVRWIDATGAPADDVPDEQSAVRNVVKVKGSDDFEGITSSLERLIKEFEKEEQPYFRLAYFSLSMSITQAEDKQSFLFVQGLAGRIRQARAVSMFAVERGMHTEQQLESIQHQMTGALLFKTDKQKTLLSVQGITDAQTRDWIEYKHTNKAVMIGAFSLERIR